MGNINIGEDIRRRKQRWLDLYDGKINSVLLLSLNCGERALPYPENKNKRIEYGINSYRIYLDAIEKNSGDDRVPALSPYTGTEIFARAFGCEVHYPGNDMPFALPFVKNSKDLAKVKYPDLYNSRTICEIVEIADKLREAEPDALMQLPDIQSPLGIAALIWNKEDFFASMYEDPEAVKELVAMTEKFLIEFLDFWFERYGGEFMAHFPDYYMPYGITLSEDEVGAVSPGMFREFSLGSLNRLSERYGMFGMHCCADAEHQWEDFKNIKNLKLLNFVHNPGVCEKAYIFFKDVCAQMHSANIDKEIFDKNKNMRVVISEWADNAEQAAEKSLLRNYVTM
ncbi:MAG: hypothetical protein FWH10_06485 [Oscillospiraceae bacterium]|nr:hypothetical protein [Oscillospiraceae bacterium]